MIDVLVQIFRTAFGLVFLFLIPGFALTLVIFPRMDEIRLVERVGLAGALSIVADVVTTLFIDLVLNVPTTGLNIFLALLTLTLAALAVWRLEVYFITRRTVSRENDAG